MQCLSQWQWHLRIRKQMFRPPKPAVITCQREYSEMFRQAWPTLNVLQLFAKTNIGSLCVCWIVTSTQVTSAKPGARYYRTVSYHCCHVTQLITLLFHNSVLPTTYYFYDFTVQLWTWKFKHVPWRAINKYMFINHSPRDTSVTVSIFHKRHETVLLKPERQNIYIIIK